MMMEPGEKQRTNHTKTQYLPPTEVKKSQKDFPRNEPNHQVHIRIKINQDSMCQLNVLLTPS